MLPAYPAHPLYHTCISLFEILLNYQRKVKSKANVHKIRFPMRFFSLLIV